MIRAKAGHPENRRTFVGKWGAVLERPGRWAGSGPVTEAPHGLPDPGHGPFGVPRPKPAPVREDDPVPGQSPPEYDDEEDGGPAGGRASA